MYQKLVLVTCITCLGSVTLVFSRDFQVPSEYATIMEAVAAAENGDTVLVSSGTYIEEVSFLGKAVSIRGVPDKTGAPVITNPDGIALSFENQEGPSSVLRHFIVKDSFIGVFLANSSPQLLNLTIVNNACGIEAYARSFPDIRNCILWNNTDCDIFGCEARHSYISDRETPNWDPSLLGYWGFDEGGGSVAVDLVGNYHGTIRGASRIAGKIHDALYFDGQDDYLDCGTSGAYKVLGDASISLWIKPLDFGTFLTMEGDAIDFGTDHDNVVFFLRYRQPDGFIVYTHEHGAGFNEQDIFDPIENDAWTHLVVVRNTKDRTVHVYYDGIPTGVYYYRHDPENPQDELSLTMGSRSRGEDPFNGYIDEVMIYERVLSSTEIGQLFELGHQGIPLDLSVSPDPGFVDPDNGDYHLKSQRGRYWPNHDLWVLDDTTSPCVDAGDPNSDSVGESTPNGDIINQGAYGGSPYASLSSRNLAPQVTLPEIVLQAGTCQVYAWDPDGVVVDVTFLVNGVETWQDSDPSDGWTVPLDLLDNVWPGPIDPGEHSLVAEVRDDDGAVSHSAPLFFKKFTGRGR